MFSINGRILLGNCCCFSKCCISGICSFTNKTDCVVIYVKSSAVVSMYIIKMLVKSTSAGLINNGSLMFLMTGNKAASGLPNIKFPAQFTCILVNDKAISTSIVFRQLLTYIAVKRFLAGTIITQSFR